MIHTLIYPVIWEFGTHKNSDRTTILAIKNLNLSVALELFK